MLTNKSDVADYLVTVCVQCPHCKQEHFVRLPAEALGGDTPTFGVYKGGYDEYICSACSRQEQNELTNIGD